MAVPGFDKVSFIHAPTPLEWMERLSKDQPGAKLWVKRDDCTGLAFGGNKARKLEYLVADAQRQGADVLVTSGGIQSNHARQTAAVAARFGMECSLVLEPVEGTPDDHYGSSGNVLLDSLLGADIVYAAVDQALEDQVQVVADQLILQGKKPYVIPVGGSNLVGAMGYVECALELIWQAEQMDISIDAVVVATGSVGTHAGLLAGFEMVQAAIPVYGISVSRDAEAQEEKVLTLATEILETLGLESEDLANTVQVSDHYVGEGYGIPTEGGLDAIRLLAQHEGILLDPVYTGKAMHGLLDMQAESFFLENMNVVFIHTGGAPGLFAYESVL